MRARGGGLLAGIALGVVALSDTSPGSAAAPLERDLPALPQDGPPPEGPSDRSLRGLAGGGPLCELPPASDDRVRAAIEAGLAYLALDLSTQSSGRVSLGVREHEAPVGLTALAALAFMAGGNGIDRGPEQRSLRRALDYLLEHQVPGGEPTEGYFTAVDDVRSQAHGHGLALLALTQAYTLSPQSARGRRIAEAIRAGVRRTEAAQGPDGGWYYDPLPVDLTEGSVTVCMLQALRGARNTGFEVDAGVVERAVSYVKSLQEPSGGFSYSKLERRTSVALTAGCLSTLHAIGIYEGREIEEGYLYVWRELALRDEARAKGLVGSEAQFPFYERLYLAQALWHNPDAQVFRRWWSEEVPRLLVEQRPDGSWPDRRFDDGGNRIEGRYGSAYSTAMNVLVLALPEGWLPIFQR